MHIIISDVHISMNTYGHPGLFVVYLPVSNITQKTNQQIFMKLSGKVGRDTRITSKHRYDES